MRHMHLNAFALDVGHHEAAWRLPESRPDLAVALEHYVHLARVAEAATFDSVFLADSPVLAGDPEFRPIGGPEPLTVLGALAATTERIGLIGTASTTFEAPFNVARRFSTLDHLSRGRAGWNVVTTAFGGAAGNFGMDVLPPHAERYRRAEEFLDVVRQLWDSWDDDAPQLDKATGIYNDPRRIHAIDHDGTHHRVRGPLNLPRSPQGHPVLVQAGSSPDGIAFAAAHAEAIFTAQPTLAQAREFTRAVRRQAAAAGRDPAGVKVLPGFVPIIGSTEAEAQAIQARLDELVIPAYGLRQLSLVFGVDLTGADLDAPLPAVPHADEVEGQKSRAALIEGLARSEGLTVRRLLQRLAGGRGHRTFVGTPEQAADEMQQWLEQDGCDGFNVMPAALPSGLETFAEQVVPVLRRRGLFRHEYTGTTLREHLGLPRPGTPARARG